mmetsp:Transcript_10666/g.26943  ORF Transcript_10666/g.26943 Transcript_10666/m.26943 type:complete len:204 (-) Transcript_10666:977-1588(-)
MTRWKGIPMKYIGGKILGFCFPNDITYCLCYSRLSWFWSPFSSRFTFFHPLGLPGCMQLPKRLRGQESRPARSFICALSRDFGITREPDRNEELSSSEKLFRYERPPRSWTMERMTTENSLAAPGSSRTIMMKWATWMGAPLRGTCDCRTIPAPTVGQIFFYQKCCCWWWELLPRHWPLLPAHPHRISFQTKLSLPWGRLSTE